MNYPPEHCPRCTSRLTINRGEVECWVCGYQWRDPAEIAAVLADDRKVMASYGRKPRSHYA